MRPKASVLILLVLFGVLTSPLLAQQTGTVSGTLTNSLSGDAVADALIVLEGGSGTRQTRTGPDGKFSIQDVPPGSYHLIVRADGYLPSRSEVSVAGGLQASDLRINPELHYSEVMSVSPEGKSAFESFQATDVLGGQDLTKELQGTLGATIESQPGIALRSFGPGPARPVVRGLDGDRVLIVEDGMRMGDLSSQSGDHGVNVNPAAATSIEVVRGPATLLYGSNAIGGLVNVVTNEIPRSPVRAASGSFTFDAASNAGQAAGAGDVTVGNGRVALHLSGSGRRAGDTRLPAKIPNSFNRADSPKPASRIHPTTATSGAASHDQSHYGIPLVEEGDESRSAPTNSECSWRAPKYGRALRLGPRIVWVARYRHDELDGDVLRPPSRTTPPSRAARTSQDHRSHEGLNRRNHAHASVCHRRRRNAVARS